ncbi:MAG: RNA polymerase sigma factor [Bacteroidales bacterium]|nr:RNA polymerase sigma factor [Bacteroidales bacterium]
MNSQLIEECRQGNVRSQYRLYNQYVKAMYNLACRMLYNREDAEDIIQEAFTDCFANIATYRYESTFGAWLKSIVVNKCINHLKRKKADLVNEETLPEPAIMETETEPRYNHRQVLSAIERLPDGYRMIFNLYMMEGYDHEEIASILGISESTSKSQYMRAKEKIKKILLDEQRNR